MLSRLAAVSIVAFWLCMMTALIRMQRFPESSVLLAVPVSHVLGLMFAHEQTSALNVFENGAPAGNLSLHAHADPSGRMIESNGYVFIHLPDMARQRMAWRSAAELDAEYRLRRLQLNLTLREPAVDVELRFDSPRRIATYAVHQNDGGSVDGTLNLRDLAHDPQVKNLGLPPEFFASAQQNFHAPTVEARRSSILLKQEKVDAYLVRFRQGDSVLAEFYVSQLGQVLSAHTALGYTLSADDTLP